MIKEFKQNWDKSEIFCDWCITKIGIINDIEMGLLPKTTIAIDSGKKGVHHFCNSKCAKAFNKKNNKK